MKVLLTYFKRVKNIKDLIHIKRWQWWTGGCVAAVLFAAYLLFLYTQLDSAFHKQDDFAPTRIYTDIIRLRLGQPRGYIYKRLKDLSYDVQAVERRLTFVLREITYPTYLLPQNHPTIEWQGKPVTLEFDGASDTSKLLTIKSAENSEIPDLYLEPELVTALSRTTSGSAKGEIRDYLKFQDIPAQVWQSIISIEDQHFLDHNGLDPRGFARAIWVNLKTLSFAQGGSTLTQQLVKNLMARRTKNVFKKINELFLALLLEARYDKEKILERYLNEVYLGQVGTYEIHGVSEGAKHFFGKTVQELNLGETALMAGLIRGPGFYSPYRHLDRATKRQQLVLQKMVETRQIAPEEMDEAVHQPIRLVPPTVATNRAPYFTDYVKAELIRQLKDRMAESEISDAGFRVYTTLDLYLNTLAQKSVTEGLSQLERRLGIPVVSFSGLEGALASVEHGTGYIRALVGGRDYVRSNFNRILNMKRQVGSTFKPIVYLAALKNGWGPGTPVLDAPWKLTYDRGKQFWEPKNYDPEFRGWITMREALIHSINTVASRIGTLVGLDAVIENAKMLGIESEILKVPSLSLGITELSPIELLRVYSVLANAGQADELTVIRAITQEDGAGYARFVYHPKAVMDAGFAAWMTTLLKDVFKEGTARSASAWGFNRPAAGKTGTTSHHRDAWFAGYTPQWTTVVWVGLDQGSGMDEKGVAKFKLTGAGSALPIWSEYMRKVHENEDLKDFGDVEPAFQQLVDVAIDKKSGRRATMGCPGDQVVHEKYLKGYEPTSEDCAAAYPIWEKESDRPDIH